MNATSGQLRDTAERNALVLQWRFLPRKVIRRLLHGRPDARRLLSRLEFADLEQVGLLGLMGAAERWDPAGRAKFSTFAFHWIRNYVRNEVKRRVYSRRGPTRLTAEPPARVGNDAAHEDLRLALSRLCEDERELLERRFGLDGRRPQTVTGIARELGRTRENVRKRLARVLAQIGEYLGHAA
jgi:RNA polymerase sigma factor (sigma-70 family)